MRFLVRRLLQAVAVVYLVVTATFFLVRLAPGDPFLNGGDGRNVPPEVLERQREHYGVDRPIVEQYVTYVRGVLTGDFGFSFSRRQPVTQVLAAPLVNSLVLGMAALFVNFGLGVAVGALQAWREGSRLDHALTLITLAFFSIPLFWLGIVTIELFAARLGWFPSGGISDPSTYLSLSWSGRVIQRLHHLILPALTVGLVGAAWTARYMRAQTLDVLHRDHVRTARAKGLSDLTVLVRHVARNALVPIVTLFGLYLPILLSGSVFAETVFTWNGLGWLAADAVAEYDYPLIAATAILTAGVVTAGNLTADLLYRVVDPRIAVE